MEVVVGAAIMVLVFLSLVSAYAMYLRGGLANPNRIQAALLAEEGIEALKYLRDGSWNTNINSLTIGSPYYLDFSAGTWKATTTPSSIDGKFARTFVLNSVMRNASSDIVLSGGTNDTGARLAKVSVSWHSADGTITSNISSYIFNLYGN